MKRFWCSWYEPAEYDEDGEYVELVMGADTGIVRAWANGWVLCGFGPEQGSAGIVCAVVDAATERDARRLVLKAGYHPARWRFVTEQAAGWMPPADRFP
ncbi:MAG TPA: hypothetical protein VK607_10645 [Kofleriaceae bacterium]|nr:hypothetical protein [Kofleriaceae bacterium]